VSRLAMPDIPSPHNPALMEWALPSVETISGKVGELIGF
jgi:2-oxoisovalerate dehydrogenase E1 component